MIVLVLALATAGDGWTWSSFCDDPAPPAAISPPASAIPRSRPPSATGPASSWRATAPAASLLGLTTRAAPEKSDAAPAAEIPEPDPAPPPKSPPTAPPPTPPPGWVWITNEGRFGWGWIGPTGYFRPAVPTGPPPPVLVPVPRRPALRWRVRQAPPGYTLGQMDDLLRDAASRWAVADVEIVRAAEGQTANLVVDAPSLTLDRVGDATPGSPAAVRSGVVLTYRVNASVPLSRRRLLANAVHEIGHALGLGHGPNGTVMETACYGTTELAASDRAAILSLYGAAR
jgi:hypothetical protein